MRVVTMRAFLVQVEFDGPLPGRDGTMLMLGALDSAGRIVGAVLASNLMASPFPHECGKSDPAGPKRGFLSVQLEVDNVANILDIVSDAVRALPVPLGIVHLVTTEVARADTPPIWPPV